MNTIPYKENLKILLVDDDPMNLMLLKTVLKTENYKTDSCLNGFDAIEKANNNKYDLILLDIMMPAINGYQVCEKLKQNEKTKRIPIVFITAKNDSESITEAFEVGGIDYITKPFKKKELLARVSTHLSLKIKTDSLRELNESLDQKVRTRTKQLENANHKIKTFAEELSVSNEQLEYNNQKLRNTLDELTKTKISKKATTLAILIALILFLISEAIIEPYIEGHNNNFFLSLGLKALIALLFKPIEMLLEYLMIHRKNARITIIPDTPVKHSGIFNMDDL